ncbi:hypothetical protein BN59_01691 [Legionella massiliensis]|uniref:Uncharacterized protein n=1 Tax=Legionella massiliensis TaxID=1034943 RepID=A0A078L070_9GAMM|nr:hypothetical protein [Legionella massiliensis]CDZ77408.1 hypothetical protein BN59_01691 [Legionella massiliensis]CEE13146.1 hypothetical protein BN1094_01691 [Legionella massiliensis]
MFQREEPNPFIERLRECFYTTLLEMALAEEDINIARFEGYILSFIKQIILNGLNSSKNIDHGIRLFPGLVIDDGNCPGIYLAFFQGLKQINGRFRLLGAEHDLTMSELPQALNESIEQLASRLMANDVFQFMLPQLMEITGLTEAKRPLDSQGITKELIRETFYDEMVTQTFDAMSLGLITGDDLEGQESFIYFALSSLTIVAAIINSRHQPGIEVLNQKLVTLENCPQDDNFPIFVSIILEAKILMQALYDKDNNISPEDLLALKTLLVSYANEHAKEQEYSENISTCAKAINKMSIKISQSPMFKQMISSVIEIAKPTVTQTCS